MLLNVRGVIKEFANERVLDGVDLRIEARDKLALVGRNGAGKTTLLKILNGEHDPDGGSVSWARGAKVGYLRQHAQITEGQTVLQAAEEARAHLVELESRLKDLEAKLEDAPSDDDLEEYARLHEHFHSEGGYSLERDLQIVLKRMGFEESEFAKPVEKLSGGETTRLMLARLLLEEPDLLILDEPTNHLDLEATEWLEGWIRAYHGAVLLVSHDRTFLANTADRVAELRDGRVKTYEAGFEKYLALRAADEERAAEVYRRQQEEIAKLDEYVRRFMNSQRTAQARGRLKQMEKLQSEAIEAPKAERGIAAGFGKTKRAGDIVFATKGLSKFYPTKDLFSGLNWTVGWGERWGVIGGNGAGKSTLVKIVLGRMDASEGEVRLGSNVNVGYFSQDASTLNLELSPMMYLHEVHGLDLPAARNLLGRFLLSGDDATRAMKTLSGGERNKVQLAALTALSPNVLVLDEPTNHLDMASREALAEVLKEFNGTLVLVSHDRWLLDQVTEKTLDVQPGKVTEYGGAYGEYKRWREKARSSAVKSAVASKTEDAPTSAPTLNPRELSKEIGRTQKELEALEERITVAESRLATIETKMANPGAADDLVALSLQHTEASTDLESLMAEWELTGMKLESLRSQQG